MTIRTSALGFTLIEVLLSLAVASGVGLALFSAFQLITSIRTRQQSAGVVVWEGDLVVHRLRLLVSRGFTEPAPQGASEVLTLSDGATVRELDGVLVLSASGSDAVLSSPDVRLSSLSFSDLGTVEFPGLLKIDFTVSTIASDSRLYYEQRYNTSIYAH